MEYTKNIVAQKYKKNKINKQRRLLKEKKVNVNQCLLYITRLSILSDA